MIPAVKRGRIALPLSTLDGLSRCLMDKHVPSIRNAFCTVCSFYTWHALMDEHLCNSLAELIGREAVCG